LLESECREQLQAFFKRRRKEIKALKKEQQAQSDHDDVDVEEK